MIKEECMINDVKIDLIKILMFLHINNVGIVKFVHLWHKTL